jgi:pimeloyl-ACP methyl ester carboxylesterase
MAKSRPELFQAFVGTGQVSDPSKALKVGYDALLAKAHALGDARAIRELEEVGPPPWKKGPGYQVQHRWANLFERADFFISSTTGFGLNAPGYTFPRDIDDWLDGEVLSGERLQDELIAMPASELRGKFAIPMYAIQGDEDFTTPTALAKSWVDDIEAPRKAFVTIQGGHFAAFTNPSQFLQALGRVLQPAAHH